MNKFITSWVSYISPIITAFILKVLDNGNPLTFVLVLTSMNLFIMIMIKLKCWLLINSTIKVKSGEALISPDGRKTKYACTYEIVSGWDGNVSVKLKTKESSSYSYNVDLNKINDIKTELIYKYQNVPLKDNGLNDHIGVSKIVITNRKISKWNYTNLNSERKTSGKIAIKK